MTNNGSKADNPTPETLPESDAFGRSQQRHFGPLRPPLRTLEVTDPTDGRGASLKGTRQRSAKDLGQAVKDFALGLKKDFATRIATDAKAFKKLCIQHLKQSLPPGPGRPAEESITGAMKLRAQGIEWPQVYPQCIPEHATLPIRIRRQKESDLRAGCRSRRNATRRNLRAKSPRET